MYSTVKYSTVKYSTVKYSTVKYSTVKYSTVKYSTVKYPSFNRFPCGTLYFLLCSTTSHHTTPQTILSYYPSTSLTSSLTETSLTVLTFISLSFMSTAITETLEADVRSKFQTKRRIEDCKRGVLVEVPFDATIVKFLWREERMLEVMEIVLN